MGNEPEALNERWRNGRGGTDQSSDLRKVLKLLAFQPSFQHTEIVAKDKGDEENYWPGGKDKLVVSVIF